MFLNGLSFLLLLEFKFTMGALFTLFAGQAFLCDARGAGLSYFLLLLGGLLHHLAKCFFFLFLLFNHLQVGVFV